MTPFSARQRGGTTALSLADRADEPTMRLTAVCADRPGIVSALSSCLFDHGLNIVSAAQHTSELTGGTFFARIEFTGPASSLAACSRRLRTAVAPRFDARLTLTQVGVPKRVAVLVSRYDHCLLDLLWRVDRGELEAEVTQVVSNHPDLEGAVKGFGIPFAHVPISAETKAESERILVELLRGRCDLVVLARYMQILSGDVLEQLGVPVINVHHSLLPAFVGANPYERARDRGVKLIGATAHYVTEELDAGPIIEQGVARVSHRDSLEAFRRRGRDIEREVLSRAVAWHCEDRVLAHGNATIVL